MRSHGWVAALVTICGVAAACGGQIGGTPSPAADAGPDVVHSIIQPNNGECPGGEPTGSPCAPVGSTCSIFLGAAGCGGECVCQSSGWQCTISCGPEGDDGSTNAIDASPGVDASFAEVDAFTSFGDVSVVPAPESGVLPLADGGVCCSDEENRQFPPADSCSGGSVAWAYVPSCSLTAALLELYDMGGPVAILDSDGMMPGATLWSGTLPTSGTPAWHPVEIFPALQLVPGHLYFIYEPGGTCSIASAGTEQPYYAASPTGWNGPYSGHAFTAQLSALCE